MPDKPLQVLKEKIGESHDTVENLQVELGKVDEFARAIKDESPVYLYSGNNTKETPVPLTFTRVSRFPRYQFDDLTGYLGFDLGFDPSYTVHGEEEYDFERPVYAGDTLSATTTLTAIYQREGSRGGTMTFAEFETEYRDADDRRVVTERHVRIETEGGIDGEGDVDD